MMGTEHFGFILRAVRSLGEVFRSRGYCHFGNDPSGYLGREWIQGDKVGQDSKGGCFSVQVRGRVLGKDNEKGREAGK